MPETLLELKNITKEFPGVKALDNVSLDVRPGEVIGIIGENGAGKSTLMKVLTGVYPPTSGSIVYKGSQVKFENTAEAYEKGINIVFQEFNLCGNLTVMENLFLGNELKKRGLVDYAEMKRRAKAMFDKLGFKINPTAIVNDLGAAQQQMIEIAKALSHETKILILDEPTAVLTDKEIDRLLEFMDELRSSGMAILFITHKLNEVKAITDRIFCLRDGQNSGYALTKDITEDDMVSMMVGRNADEIYGRKVRRDIAEDVVLEVKNLSGPPFIKDISFKLNRGEILGVAGLIASGRTELAMLISGAVQKTAGEIYLDGDRVVINSPADAVKNRIAYVSEDRKKLGLILPMTVRENTTMAIHSKVSERFMLRRNRENEVSDRYIKRFSTKVYSREQVIGTLSGGNQQKVCLGKWLAIDPKILILDEPTRGIDVGAKAEIHRIVEELAEKEGMSIIVISSELPEILRLSDRVLVMHEGRLTADIPGAEANEESIMKAALA